MLPYRTIIAIEHDDPHENLPIFFLLLNRRVTVLETRDIDEIEEQPAQIVREQPRRLIARKPPDEQPTQPRRRYTGQRQRKLAEAEALGFVMKRVKTNVTIDVPATCQNLGIDIENLRTGKFDTGSREYTLSKSLKMQERTGKKLA